MDSRSVIRWIMSWCPSVLWRSQAKALSELVAAAMTMDCISLAALGRSLSRLRPVAVKHCMKRVERFVGNPRIEPTTAMQPVTKMAGPAARTPAGQPGLGGHSAASLPGSGRSSARSGITSSMGGMPKLGMSQPLVGANHS